MRWDWTRGRSIDDLADRLPFSSRTIISHSPPLNLRAESGPQHNNRYNKSRSCSNAMLLYLPQEIWEMVFDLLHGQDLQSISKVQPTLSPPGTPTVLSVYQSSFASSRFPGFASSWKSPGVQCTNSNFTGREWSIYR